MSPRCSFHIVTGVSHLWLRRVSAREHNLLLSKCWVDPQGRVDVRSAIKNGEIYGSSRKRNFDYYELIICSHFSKRALWIKHNWKYFSEYFTHPVYILTFPFLYGLFWAMFQNPVRILKTVAWSCHRKLWACSRTLFSVSAMKVIWWHFLEMRLNFNLTASTPTRTFQSIRRHW